MDINKILESFGNDRKYINITFDTASSAWVVSYNDNECKTYTATDTDMLKAVSSMHKWYSEFHTYKAAAEFLWTIIDKIEIEVMKWTLADKHQDTILSLAHLRNKIITKANNTLLWDPSYEKCGKPLENKCDATEVTKTIKNTVQQDVRSLDDETYDSPDSFPPFCVFNSDSLTVLECWGVDKSGKRIHVQLNYIDTRNTKVDEKPITGMNPEKLSEINASEFYNYYDEANAMINALNSGYGVDDFSKYNIIK